MILLLQFSWQAQHLVILPSGGRHACSRRCQLARDLTARGIGFTPPSLALSGRLQRGWWFCFVVFFEFVAFVEKKSRVFATIHLVLADRRATARTTTFVEPCSIQTKKAQKEEAFVNTLIQSATGLSCVKYRTCM